MRWLAFVAVISGCGGGQSIGPGACDNTQPDPMCCTQDTECNADGTFGNTCLAPGAFAGCGVCNGEPSECAGDTDCKAMGATMICQPRTCACNGELACVAGCTADSQCADAQTCDLTTNRCQAQVCTTTPDCPVDFDCTNGHCARAACTNSSECDAFCVDGACYQQAGECVPIPV